ncbi:MAG TPA: response regulator [Candidatus Limnocylindrales bacterium]|nr:response regulator [Candidatus Limnocylindrales bacterium]
MSPEQASARILVVDDSPVDRAVVARLLASDGYEVVEAENGRQALDLLRANGVDAVITDLLMPELDGFATLAAIRADEKHGHIPVIVITGLDDLDSAVRCIELGATDYVLRPVKPALLRARIRASLENARLLETIDRQKSELARFISPQIAQLITSPEGEQLLAGHRRRITVVFCDLRGFTSFSETAEPEEVLGVLRAYHVTLGRLIVEHGGTLEHFAGDGVMVFFNDPVLQDDHEIRAVSMAVAMRTAVAGLASNWRKLGYELGFGVGIVAGYATLGRIGFEGRHDYGAVGNAVNLAARLSSEAAPDQILLDQRTYAAVEDQVEVASVGELSLKGLHRPVPAFDVLAVRSAVLEPVAPDR